MSWVEQLQYIGFFFRFYDIVYNCIVSPMTGQQETCLRCVDMGKDVGAE